MLWRISLITWDSSPAIMETSQPVAVFDSLGVNVSFAKALIQEYDKELSAVEEQIAQVEEDKREDERILRSSKEDMRKQLQRQIDDLKAQELVEVDQLEVASQARRAPLDEKRNSILAQIEGVKISIAPIRNIPAEILGCIFRQVVALDVAPWLLTIVSKSWRRTALTNPWMWSNIYVGLLHSYLRSSDLSKWIVDGISRLCYGGRVVCRNVDDLAYFADKSGVVPLDVQAYSGLRRDGWEVLQPLLGPNYSSRISSLSIMLSGGLEVATGWSLGPFPLLQNLSCSSTQEPLVALVMAQAHQVKNLAPTHLSSDLPKYSFWKTLRELNLGRWGDAGELNLVVSALSLIEVIEGCPKSWPDARTPVTTLKHNKSINLTCQLKYLACLQLPRLEKLVWSEVDPPPSLTNSTALSIDPDWGLSFPNLVEFEAYAAGEMFALALKEFPNIQTALLEPITPKKSQDTWALDLIQSLAAVDEFICPKLRRLTLGRLMRVKANKTFAKPLIRRLIKSRKELGTPIEHLQIAWTKRAGKNEETVQYA
jgi:hypothetical protein